MQGNLTKVLFQKIPSTECFIFLAVETSGEIPRNAPSVLLVPLNIMYYLQAKIRRTIRVNAAKHILKGMPGDKFCSEAPMIKPSRDKGTRPKPKINGS